MNSKQNPDRLAKLIEYLVRSSDPNKTESKLYRLEDIIGCIDLLDVCGWNVKRAMKSMNANPSSYERQYDINLFMSHLTDQELYRVESDVLITADKRLSAEFMSAKLKTTMDLIYQHYLKESRSLNDGIIEKRSLPKLDRGW